MDAEAREGEVDQVLWARARDFLRRFSGDFSVDEVAEAAGGDYDEIELGLSLGGCFRSHGRDGNRLVRSSSIPTVVLHEFLPAVPLARACSLPSDTEEELRRKKELQILKRMEAKRKREGRLIPKRSGERSGEDIEGRSITKSRRFDLQNGSSSWIPVSGQANGVVPHGLPRWIAGASRPSLSVKTFSPAMQASVASQRSCSSGGSEFESRSGQAVAGEDACQHHLHMCYKVSLPLVVNVFEACEPGTCASNLTTMEDRSNIISFSSSSSNGLLNKENPLKKNAGRINNGDGEMGKKMMEEMPCVSTMGIGPNGRKIEGFLYRCRKGEEVRIVCVCHGRFLSPAEFVKHAGGGDVAHPLRHIVVNPSTAALL